MPGWQPHIIRRHHAQPRISATHFRLYSLSTGLFTSFAESTAFGMVEMDVLATHRTACRPVVAQNRGQHFKHVVD
jgi:hypothetical protein